MAKAKKDIPEGYVEKFTTFITLRDGRRIYARWYGKKVFRLIVPAEKAA